MVRRYSLIVILALALLVPVALPLRAGPARGQGLDPGFVTSSPAYSLALVGALQLEPFNQGVHADVAAYKNLAFVGKWRGPCPGTGVDIIDITDPAAPVKLADTDDYADTSMEDMQAMEIGGRDVLAIGLQDCGNDPTPGAGTKGLELVDITEPSRPRRLSLFETGAGGVHELSLTRTPGGRVLALLAVPSLEVVTAGKSGDLMIVDITNPANPVLASTWGIMGEPALGRAFANSARRGTFAATFAHSARASADGTRAYVSYWDAGVMVLDIADPANPRYLGRTTFAPDEEGNAHSVAETRGGALLVAADENFTPSRLSFTVAAPESLAREYSAAEGQFTRPIASLPGRALAGEVVHVGRGCPAGTVGAPAEGDPYLADPAGRVALVERGLCPFDNKVARAQLAGATGVIVYNSAAEGDAVLAMGGANPVAAGAPSAIGTRITIPGVFVGRATGVALRDALAAGQAVSVGAKAGFSGWGYLHFYDVADPARPVQVSTFATANATDPAVANQGSYTVHNPEVRGDLVFASWYSDGLRVIDISQPALPREVAAWTGAGAPAGAPPVKLWGVAFHDDLILLSDENFGLYILRLDAR